MSESSSSTLMEDSSSHSSDGSNANHIEIQESKGWSCLEQATRYASSPSSSSSSSSFSPLSLPSQSASFPSSLTTNIHEKSNLSDLSNKQNPAIYVSNHEVTTVSSVEADPDDIFDFDNVDPLGQPLVRTMRTREEMALWRAIYPEDEPSDEEDMSAGRVNDILAELEQRLCEQQEIIERLSPSLTRPPKRNNRINECPEPYMRSSNTVVRPNPQSLIINTKNYMSQTLQHTETPSVISKPSKRDGTW